MNAQSYRILTLFSVWAAMGGLEMYAAEKAPVESKGKPPPVVIATPPAAKTFETDAYVREFDSVRQAYLKKLAEAHKASKELSEQQRQEMRERLRVQRAEQARAREELRQQLRQLREQLPTHRDLIDDARERAGSRKRRGD